MAAPRLDSDATALIPAPRRGPTQDAAAREVPAAARWRAREIDISEIQTSEIPARTNPGRAIDGAFGSVLDAARTAGVLTGVWPDAVTPCAAIVCVDGRSWGVYPDPAGTGDWLATRLDQHGALDTSGALRMSIIRGETYPATWWARFLAGSALPDVSAAPGDGATHASRTPAQLMAPLIDLARQLSGMATLDEALSALPRASLPAVPGAQHAAVTRRRSRDRFATVASSDEIALQADRIQYACNEGPCLDAVTKCAVVRVGNISHDFRWPVAGHRMAAARGIESVLAARLPLDGDKLSLSVNLYSCELAAFDSHAEDTAVLLAWQAGVALRAVRERERADQLAVALQTNRQIAKAIGLLMARLSISDDEAFNMMRVTSQHSHRRLTDVADCVLRNRGLEVPPEWLETRADHTAEFS